MNLEQELRAVLSQEAEMTNATRPDIDGLLSGGQVRRRRRNVAWIGGIAAAVVLVGGGVVALTQIDGGDDGDSKTASEPTPTSESPSLTVPLYRDMDEGRLAPGTYRMTPATFGDGLEVGADVTFLGAGWEARSNPTVSDDNGVASIAIYEPVAVATGSGCVGDAGVERGVGQTPDSLVRELARLPRSEVVQPPTATAAFGLAAIHLRVRVDQNCLPVAYGPVETTADGPRGMTFTEKDEVLIVDFWVVEVDGIVLAVDLVRNPGTPPAVVQQAADAVDSITFVSEE